ncbi:MAG: DUF6476 family protein [Alkalilacustris sp.]
MDTPPTDRSAAAPPPQASPPPEVRFLKILVGSLAAVMIAGMVTIVGLLVLRLPGPTTDLPQLALPDEIALPPGLTAEAVTLGRDFIAVVAGDEILIFDRPGGALRQRIQLSPAAP